LGSTANLGTKNRLLDVTVAEECLVAKVGKSHAYTTGVLIRNSRQQQRANQQGQFLDGKAEDLIFRIFAHRVDDRSLRWALALTLVATAVVVRLLKEGDDGAARR